MDSDEVDDQAATVAGDSEATTSVPPQTDAELAWSQVDETDEPTRRPRHGRWAIAGVLVLGAVILVAVAGIVGWAIWPSAKPRRPTAAPLPTATSVVPVQARAAGRRHADTSYRRARNHPGG